MHLYIVLTIVTIFYVVYVMTEGENYDMKMALVLMRTYKHSRFIGDKLYRPTSAVKRANEDPHQYSSENPYHYDERDSVPYYFCPKNEDTKLLFGKILSKNNDVQSSWHCRFPLRTSFSYLDLTINFKTGWLYSHGYEYCYPKDETEILFRNESVYTFHYLRDAMRIQYVKYIIYSRNMPAGEENFVIEPTSLVEEHVHEYEKLKNGLEDMENKMKDFPLEGSSQTLGEKQDYYRATLASRFHFSFPQYKVPLFHYSNITLVHKDVLNLFVQTQKYISTIEMDPLRIFAVPYFYDQKSDTENNEYPYRRYAPDIIGYLIFDYVKEKGIAIILHNGSESDKVITPQCENDEEKMQCQTYHDHLLKNKELVGEKNLTRAYCCKIMHILKKWNFLKPFEVTEENFIDLDI